MSDYQYDQEALNGCLEFDDICNQDGGQFVTLKEGDYVFTVTNFERARFPGGPKIPPCHKAVITLQVDTDEGSATVRVDFILHTISLWKISQFFRSVGMKEKGKDIKMDWKGAVGRTGKAHFCPRTYNGADGTEKTTNDVKYFLDPEPGMNHVADNFTADTFSEVSSKDPLPF